VYACNRHVIKGGLQYMKCSSVDIIHADVRMRMSNVNKQKSLEHHAV